MLRNVLAKKKKKIKQLISLNLKRQIDFQQSIFHVTGEDFFKSKFYVTVLCYTGNMDNFI